MDVRIVETIGTYKNPDIKKWYEAKIKELAHFLINKAKNQIIFEEEPVFTEQKELEVMVK
jgi:hypothetical protein